MAEGQGYRRYTDEQRNAAKTMLIQGARSVDIADQLGVSKDAVAYWKRTLGLTRKNTKREWKHNKSTEESMREVLRKAEIDQPLLDAWDRETENWRGVARRRDSKKAQ